MPRSFCSILLALLVLIGGSHSVFALTADDLKPLAEDDFDAKSQALDRIIAAGDATALRVLEAMGQENVVATSDDRVLIQDGDVLKDPITDAPVEIKASDVQANHAEQFATGARRERFERAQTAGSGSLGP